MEPSLDEKARRVRSLLSSYYGGDGAGGAEGGEGEGGQGGGSTRISGARASGIDSATFDADRFIRSLLKGTRIDGLMAKSVEMATEVRSLDGDMQMLVYENYNKFISATDTIRSMKTNVDGMGSQMEELMSTIDSVAERSNAVNSKLQQRRDNIEDLNRVRALLRKLQAVFDLPRKLRAALDADALEIAVQQYTAAAPVLKKYGHQGTFRGVAAEAGELSREVVAALRKRLLERKDEASECIQLLRRMGEPVEALQEDFLECRRVRMEAILAGAERVVDLMCVAAGLECSGGGEAAEGERGWGVGPDGEPPALSTLVVELNTRFFGEVGQAASACTDLFPDGRRRLLEVLKGLYVAYFGVVRRAVAASAAALASEAAGLATFASDVVNPDELPPPLGNDWGGAALVGALRTLSADLNRMVGLLPELALPDRGAEVVEAAVRHHVGACHRALEMRIVGELHAAYRAISKAGGGGGLGQQGVDSLTRSQVLIKSQVRVAEVLRAAPRSILAGMRSLLDEGARILDSWRDMYVDLVQGSLQNLLLAVLAHFTVLAGVASPSTLPSFHYGSFSANLLYPATPTNRTPLLSPTSTSDRGPFSPLNLSTLTIGTPDGARPPYALATGDPAPPGAVLLLACLCTIMETSVLPLCMEQLADRFPGSGGGGGGDQPPPFVAGAVARRIAATASTLLSAYVEAHGRKLSLMVRRSVDSTNWLICKEPRAPRAVCVLFLDRLSMAEAEVVQLIDDGGERSSSSAPASDGGGQQFMAGAGSLQRNVARLFTEKVKIFGEVRFTQASVLSAVARVGVKSLVECVRLQTVSRAGLQQLQLDVHFLRPQLRRFSSAAASVDSLLDEVVGAAMERSVEPTLLEPGLLDRILDSYAKSRE